MVSVLRGSDGPQSSGTRLEGVVRDSSGAAVRGAEVLVAIEDHRVVETTDSAGRFSLSIPPALSARIAVRAEGFVTVERIWTPSESAQLEIVLHPATLTDEITVTATRTAERVSDTAASVTVLSREELDTSGALTLDAKLRQVPGLRSSGARAAERPIPRRRAFRCAAWGQAEQDGRWSSWMACL